MKNKTFAFLFLSALLAMQGCYKIEPYTPDPDKIYVPGRRIKPRVEKDFVQDPALRVQLGTLVVLQLEHLNSPPSSLGPDTDSIGVDQVRYSVEDSTTLIYRRDDNSSYSLRFYDEDQNVMYFDVKGPGEEVQIHLGPGKYILKVISHIPYGNDTVGYQMVFLQPAKETPAKNGKLSEEPDYWFITSRVMECVECDLAGLDLQGKYLLGADFQRADLSDVNLLGANLKTAKIMHAKMNKVNLGFADLKGANLSFSEVKSADLRFADFSYSILNATDISYSKAQGTNFCFATKNSWVIDGVLTDTSTQCFP